MGKISIVIVVRLQNEDIISIIFLLTACSQGENIKRLNLMSLLPMK